MMGEDIDGKKAAKWDLINEALRSAQLEARVIEVAQVVLATNEDALRATKWVIRRVRGMAYDNAKDYLIRARKAANFFDKEGCKEATRQFIDAKTFKPGLAGVEVRALQLVAD